MLATLLLTLFLADGDWMTDNGVKLELMVAKLEDGKLCGGYLRVDRASKSLHFDKGPDTDMGCKRLAEAAASDVKAVKTGDGAGFLVDLASGKERKLLLIPLPHAQWLLAQPMVQYKNVGQQLESAGIRDRDGNPVHVGGSSGSAGARTKQVAIPENVAADTKRAADAVQAALAGR
jgi:hypothetical protein